MKISRFSGNHHGVCSTTGITRFQRLSNENTPARAKSPGRHNVENISKDQRRSLLLYRVIIDSKDRRLCLRNVWKAFRDAKSATKWHSTVTWTKKDQEEEEEEKGEGESGREEKMERTWKAWKWVASGKEFPRKRRGDRISCLDGGEGGRSFRSPCFRRFVTEYTSARRKKKKYTRKKGSHTSTVETREREKLRATRQAKRTCKYMREPK